MKFLRRDGDLMYFDFVCPCCGAEGELGVKPGRAPIPCPEGCGAAFVLWERPVTEVVNPHTVPDLKCVVRPIQKRTK